MPLKPSTLLLLLCIPALFNLCYADLPIHCLQHQVAGQWTLQFSEPELLTDSTSISCGHSMPDNPAESYLSLRNSFTPAKEVLVTLGSDSQVTGKSQVNGTWTMIYDEGMDIIYDNHRFTSFFEYFPNETGKVMSYCGRTVVGWYQNLLSGKRACFKGEKHVQSEEEKASLYGEPLVQMHVVQPEDVTGFLQLGVNSKVVKNSRLGMSLNRLKNSVTHQYIVDKLNSIPTKLWKARVYPNFQDKNLMDLNLYAGRKKSTRAGQRPSLHNSFIQTADVSDLPREFTWANMISPARSQASCGSCYVFSTMAMLEARLRIKYQKDVHLSVQHVLDCSFYNQGCKGGYPFLVEKFANDFELVPESCSPYQGQDGQCSKCNTKSLNEVYRVTNYKFLGGAYGKSNQREMMVELMKNGPIVVSFEPTHDFMYYESGIYHSVDAEWMENGNRPEWERVDHSVMLYGWGETEDGTKYWNVMNSWGEDWGENGSFRMMRGVDESAIESMGEAADPIIIKQGML